MEKRADILRLAGQALFAANWQSPLARKLGVADRTVRYWSKGEREIPDAAMSHLVHLLRERGEELKTTTTLVESFINRAE